MMLKISLIIILPVCISFSILSLFLVNEPHVLYVNAGYFKCISDMKLSPTSKNLFHNFIHFYTPENKTFKNGILLNGVLIPKLLNKFFASCSFRNLEFLNPYSIHFDCIVNLPFFVLKIFESKFSVFVLHFAQ